LNIYQFSYFNQKITEKHLKMQNISPIRLNTDYLSVAELENPDITSGFFKQQELMSQLTKWLGTQQGVGSNQQSAKPTEKVKEKVEEKKEAVKILKR